MVFNTHTNCPHVDTLKLHTHMHIYIHTMLFHILLLGGCSILKNFSFIEDMLFLCKSSINLLIGYVLRCTMTNSCY